MAQNQPLDEVEKRFKAKVDTPDNFLQSDYIVGFEYLNIPIITNDTPEIISTNYHWGLVPTWSKDLDFRKNTLNARIETLKEKPSFRNVTSNRCLVVASSYFEWRWLDEKGKQKEKTQIFSQEDEVIAFAGIYDTWENKANGEIYNSFSIVTTQANELMKYVHNHKERMPIIIRSSDDKAWLDSDNDVMDFSYPNYDHRLISFTV